MDIAYTAHEIHFVWDEKKAEANRKKHGISFQEACEVFFDPFLKVVDASRNREDRDAVIGYDKLNRLWFVVYVEHEADALRIISAMDATKQERRYTLPDWVLAVVAFVTLNPHVLLSTLRLLATRRLG